MADESRRAVISGVGVVTAAGSGMSALSAALEEGRLLAKPVAAFDASGFPVAVACEVPGLDARALARTPKDAKILARSAVLALGALEDLKASTPGRWFDDPWTAGFFLGVGMEQGDHRDVLGMLAASRRRGKVILARLASQGMDAMNPLSSLKTLPNMSLAQIGIKLGDDAPRGPNAAYSPFDAASIEAVAAAAEAIVTGECDVALAGGVDAPVSLFGMTAFHRLGIVRDARPLGEAAALFLVETEDRARANGRTPLVELRGWGAASDGNRVGLESWETVAASARGALAWAGGGAGSIREIVSSVGDPVYDGDAFGCRGVKVTAVRRVFGETCAAGGALALAAAIGRLAESRDRALVTAGAFGGAAASIVVQGIA